MTSLFQSFPYLWSSLAYLLTAIIFTAAWPKGRRLLLAVGLLHLPFVLGAMLHVPAYWNPRVTCRWLIAPEDIVFALAVSMECFFLAAWPVRRRLNWVPAPRRSALRFCAITVGGLCVPAVCFALGMRDVMLITLIGYAAIACVILKLSRELWPLAVYGFIGYTTLYFMQASAVLRIWPQFTLQWTPGAQLQWTPWSIPGYELLWAAGFGLAWPLFAVYVLGVGLSSQDYRAGAGAPPARV